MSGADGIRYVRVTSTAPDQLVALARFHAMCCVEFAGENEMESIDVWRNKIASQVASGGAGERYILTFTLAFTDDEADVLLGGVQEELYLRSHCGLLPYVVVGPAARGKGLSKKLVQAAIRELNAESLRVSQRPCAEVLIELSEKRNFIGPDGKEIAPEDENDKYHTVAGAEERHAIWSRNGFKPLEFSFLHPPPLTNTTHQLCVYRGSGGPSAESVSAQTLGLFLLDEFVGIMVGVPEQDVVALWKKNMEEWLEGRDDVRLGEFR